MSRRHNVRLLHGHRCYTISQLSELLRVTKGTISRWIRLGLVPIEWKRPYLFKGWVVAAFLKALNPPRCPLANGEIYCTPCKGARRPLGETVSLVPRTPSSADFKGRCPDCKRRLFRRVRYVDIPLKLGGLTIRYEDVEAPVFSSRNGPRSEPSGEAAS